MAIINTYLKGFCVFVILSVNITILPVVQAGESDIAHYIGPIDNEHNLKFFTRIRGRDVSRLIISSSGGEVEAAIRLGLWVYENKIDVEVIEYCLSSCANYVFPAGQNKKINKGAVVAWHGNYHHLKITGLWQDEVDRKVKLQGMDYKVARNKVLSQVNKLVEMEKNYFQKIGVSEFICWIGKVSPFNVTDYYFLSKKDMEQFGIRNLVVPGGYEKTDVSDYAVLISFIRLH